MTEKTDEKSPFGRGFVAASIVIGAVLLCGLLLLITGLTSPASGASDGTATASDGTAAGVPAGSRSARGGQGQPVGDGQAVDGQPTGDGRSGGDDRPVGDGPGSGGDTVSSRGSACGLADGDQRVPTAAPGLDGWEVSRRIVVPRSRVYGPAAVDADGFRRCFAHSPTGALYAAYNAISAMADQRKAVATAGKLLLPGPDTDALISDLRKETPNEYSAPTQIAGFRVLDASRDRFTVMLAVPVEAQYVSATLTLAWSRGDWRLVPPTPGQAVGAPFSQHRDLGGFVAWSGI